MEPEITVIIVDDDFGSVQRLQDDLSAFSCIRILDTAMTAEIGKKQIIKYHPDLVFLDVELPDMSGFELLNDIQDDIQPNLRIVFYTAYDKYILDACFSFRLSVKTLFNGGVGLPYRAFSYERAERCHQHGEIVAKNIESRQSIRYPNGIRPLDSPL